MAKTQIKIFDSISEIDEKQWDTMADEHFPFSMHCFLKCLEDSQCLGSERGWEAKYFCAYEGNELLGAIWGYFKDHSYGEYIFDWEWAEISYRLGREYYPKFVSAVPFTPATGNKILTRVDLEGSKKSRVRDLLLTSLLEACSELQLSGCHFLFTTENDRESLLEHRFEERFSYQFHWHNHGYTSFEDFLQSLRRKRRKQIELERQKVREQQIQVEFLSADDLTDDKARTMYDLYLSTIDEKMAAPYLTMEFFQLVFSRFKENTLVNFAYKNGQVVAGSIAFTRGKKLFGRYWGCFEEVDCLHFEVCYYSYIEWAIENQMEVFEAGAQGPHKHPRGFLPVLTKSHHLLFDGEINQLISRFLRIERKQLRQAIEDVACKTPYKRNNS